SEPARGVFHRRRAPGRGGESTHRRRRRPGIGSGGRHTRVQRWGGRMAPFAAAVPEWQAEKCSLINHGVHGWARTEEVWNRLQIEYRLKGAARIISHRRSPNGGTQGHSFY